MTDATMICGRGVHPAAELFPMMTATEFEGLVNDIREHGQMEPIIIDNDSRIIDGRNRAKACDRLRIVPIIKRYEGDDVLQYVISHNLHRRHLTDSQRAMIGARLAERSPGSNALALAHQAKGDPLRTKEIPPSQAEVAALLSVSESSIQKAKVVQREGTPALQALVVDGATPVLTAARVAKTLAPDEQDEYVQKVRAGADPVKAAPPQGREPKPAMSDRPPTPPKYGGNRRKHAAQIDALINVLAGAVMAFDEVEELDASVTAEEATRLAGGLSPQIGALRRILKLISNKECTPS